MPSKTYNKVFNLYPEGPDSDYGVINSETVKVTIEQSWAWDEESTQDMKEYLAEFYDVSLGRVATDEDLAEESAYWEREAEKMRTAEQNNSPETNQP